MEPTNFEGATVKIAENQDEYITLPAHISPDGVVTSCWSIGFVERVRLLFTGKMYLQTLTFNASLQPQKLSVDNPILT